MSLASIGVAGALIIGATFAFFSDTETSKENILQAGSLDLKIDSEAHYAGMICLDANIDPNVVQLGWSEDIVGPSNNTRPELLTKPCEGTWALKDLDETDHFFNISDLKPGDDGENTISLHVFDNDAWGQIRVNKIVDNDVDCTEPEIESGDADPECSAKSSPTPLPNAAGELAKNMTFHLWLDQGLTPGFQCYDQPEGGCNDPAEGDNIQQTEEPNTTANGVVIPGEDYIILNLAPALQQAYANGHCNVLDGHTDYTGCHGLAADGRLVGSATYYIGVAWALNPETGNEAQTDKISADISFDITQQRNQANPYPSVVPTP